MSRRWWLMLASWVLTLATLAGCGGNATDGGGDGSAEEDSAECEPDAGRFSTEGYTYRGHVIGDAERSVEDSLELAVNRFLDGIESFGGRDEVFAELCNPAPDGSDIIGLNEDGNWRCVFGVNVALFEAAAARELALSACEDRESPPTPDPAPP